MTDLDTLLAELTSGDESRAEAAAVQFSLFGEKAFYILATMYANPDADVRWWALRALSEFDEPRVSSLLLLGLVDDSPEVQACAALGLRNHPNPKAIPQLLDLLASSDQLLSRLGRDALAALGKTATPHLIKILENPNAVHTAQLGAVRALAEIKDPDSSGPLFKVFQEGSGLMQYWAETGLDSMGIGMVFFDPN
jgi:HEAT repeat protein